MDWKEYEQVTRQIYETIGKDKGVTIQCHGNTCKVKGKSGVEHQIDVLTNHSDGLHSYKTAIECKYWDKNVDKDIVMKVAEIVEDAGLNKGVIVSKNGFTPDCISFAQYKKIGLVELREIEEADWEGRIKTIVIEMNMLIPQINNFQVIISEPQPEFDITHGPINRFEIVNQNGTKDEISKYIKEFNGELCKKNENETLDKIVKLDAGAKLRYIPDNKEIPIQGFKISGILLVGKEKIEIKGQDHVWLIMKSIFENKRYSISKYGEITERE